MWVNKKVPKIGNNLASKRNTLSIAEKSIMFKKYAIKHKTHHHRQLNETFKNAKVFWNASTAR